MVAPPPILDATVRETNRRRDWAAYRKVVEADPNTTIAPPWPPFVAPPSPSPSPSPSPAPEFGFSSLWRGTPLPSDMGHRVCNRKDSPPPLVNDGYAWWKYVLEASTPSSPRSVVGGTASRSGSEGSGFRPFSDSDTAGTSPSSSSSSSGGCSLALHTPAEDAGVVRVELAAAVVAAAAAEDDDLAACIAQMLLECRADAESEVGEDDSLADGHVYDCGLEKEIRERAAVAQQLNWMLRGVLPMG